MTMNTKLRPRIVGVLALGLLLGGCTRNAHRPPAGDGPANGTEHTFRSQNDTIAKPPAGGWPEIESVTRISLPRGALAAAFVVW
jgi:hypothetical protein